MDSRTIEMRLRLPAPDEPAVLPPLVLPAFDGFGRVAPTVQFRRRAAAPGNPRLAFAMVLLALAGAAVVIAGALRLFSDRTVPVNQLRWPPAQGVLGIQDGFTMAWPESWHRLAEGGLSQGDFTQTGISYERVALIVASTNLAGCPTSGTAGGPFAVPSGDPPAPRDISDPAVACLRAAALPEGQVRLIAEVGERSRGLMAADGPAIADTSEPTPESGWTEVIDGQPARLTVLGVSGGAAGAVETRIWDVIFPGTIDHVLRIRAEIGGPDPAAGRAAVQSVVDSIDFAAESLDLDPSSAGPILVTLIDLLDRGARESRSDFFACFPREPGTSEGTISAGPGSQLATPVRVTCSTSIATSVAGLWRITLTMTWASGDGYAAGGLVQEFFARSDGSFTGGSYSHPLNEAGAPPEGESVWLPQAPRVPPAPLDGPLGLTAGSFVELLWPGISPSDTPGTTSSEVNTGVVGWHAYVVDGPRVIDGQEWYPIQWDEGSRPTAKWVPATRDGRPTIAPVEPRCPAGEADLDALMWLTAAERLVCFGSDELTIGPVTATESQEGGALCAGPSFEPTSCPGAGNASWLETDPIRLLYGQGGPNGPVPGLLIWANPSSLGPVPTGQWLRVRGHFDDSLALNCRREPNGVAVVGEDAIRDLVLGCRVRFVVTGFEPAGAP